MESNLSIIAIFISVFSLIVAWRTMSKNSKWQQHDLKIRQDEEERKRLEPYINLVHNTYCELNDLFSKYSTTANGFFNEIINLADKYDNGKGNNTEPLRHHMCHSCYDILEELKEDILIKHPEYLFNNILNRKYRNLDYKLDLKNKKKLTKIETNLKILNEHIDPDKKHIYLDELIKRSQKVYNIYFDNKEKIDNAIKDLENSMIRYQYYDFNKKTTDFYLEFLSLLNLLLYIKEISTTYTRDYESIIDYLALSEILYKITSIMIVNEGVLKIHKY